MQDIAGSYEQLVPLNAAAKELGTSYRAVWGKIKATEAAVGVQLLEVATGGKGGGGATLTSDKLILKYQKYTDRMTLLMKKEFKRIFENKKS